MTVSSSTNRVSYAGNGSTTVFPYTYKIFDQDDLTVILRAANGVETTKTIVSDYTVSGVGSAGGGNVTMLTAPATGETLVVLREQDLIQELDIVPNDPFPADSLEGALDKLTFMVQQHEETLGRTIKASRTNTISGAEFTISAADRANKLLSFDSSGDLNITQELGTYRGDWAASTSYAQRDIVKDGGNDNLYFCNAAHTSSGSLPISSNTDAAKWDLLLDVAAFSSLYDQFDDRYLGAKSSDPATDNDGNTLIDGALYWNTTDNRLKVYDLGNTAWKFTAPSPAEQANIDALAPIAAEVAAVGAIDTDVTAVAGITANVTTVAGVAADVTTVAGISADVTAVAADATDIGTVAADIADVSTVAGISGNVTTVAGISANVTTVAGISANVTTVAGVSADVTTVAGVSANVSTVAGISANVTTVAGISADVTTVAANVAGVTSFAEKYRVGGTDPVISLDTGDLFYNTSSNLLKVYNGSAWETGVTPGSGFLSASNNLSDVADAATARTNLGLDNIDPTKATLTKSFVAGEASSIALSAAIASGGPVVAVTKEIPQTGVSSKGSWDVSATASNYELYDEAPATSLSLSSTTADGTATLGAGSFSASDVGKRIFVDDGGEAILTATDGSFSLVSEFGASTYTSGNWSLSGLDVDATNGITLSEVAVNTWDISTASFLQLFSVVAQETTPSGIFFKPDGTSMYITGFAGDDVTEYILSTAWNISTASYFQVFSVAAQETQPRDVFFKPDGTKMYIIGDLGVEVNEYNLSTAWDISTASFLQVRSISAQDASPRGFFFRSDGTKMYAVGAAGQEVNEYNLSTAWDISTASFLRVFSVSAQETDPRGIFFKPDGTKMYITGTTGDDVNEYNLSTAWDISTASFLQNFSLAAEDTAPSCIFFKPDGSRMYVIGSTGDDVNEYSIGTLAQPTAQYLPALTSTTGQIDSQYWTDINSMTADDVDNDGQVYYAVSTDDRITWKVAKASDGERPIVRNNGGTWEYNSNATYGSVTWTSATTNNEFAAIAEALGATAINQMDKVQLDAVTDGSHFTLGDTLDLAIVPYLASAGTAPTSDAVSINYDAAVLNKGAILGTDYDYDFPESDVVRLTSLATQNLKVRIV